MTQWTMYNVHCIEGQQLLLQLLQLLLLLLCLLLLLLLLLFLLCQLLTRIYNKKAEARTSAASAATFNIAIAQSSNLSKKNLCATFRLLPLLLLLLLLLLLHNELKFNKIAHEYEMCGEKFSIAPLLHSGLKVCETLVDENCKYKFV